MDTSINLDEMRLAGNLVRFVRVVDQRVRGSHDRDVLSLAELGVLGQIQKGRRLPSVLARELRLDPPRVTRLCDRLVSQGLIRRESDEDDRRRCRLELTESGVDRLTEGRRAVAKTVNALLDDLTEEERVGLTVGLEGVRRVLDDAPVKRT
ncbi:MAG: MarR family winged helix-turn-helix transcriptional regulator [Chloroflexota bacterium]